MAIQKDWDKVSIRALKEAAMAGEFPDEILRRVHEIKIQPPTDKIFALLIPNTVELKEGHDMITMRAKFQVGFVQEQFYGQDKAKSGEVLTMHAVAASKYPEDGSDEDNTYAKFTPGAHCQINIANPELWGKFEIGQQFYVDFTKAE